MKETENDFLFPLLICTLMIVPWAYIQIGLRIPADAAWLYLGAEKLLSGQRMVDSFFDNNPPMSFLIYTPAVFLHATGLSHHNAIMAYTFITIFLSSAFVLHFLQLHKKISASLRVCIFSAFIASVTLIPYMEFGQKDHLIIIALFPFLLAQYTLEKYPDLSRSSIYFCFVLFLPFILIKPHYEILPTFFLLYRAIKKRTFKFFMDPDCIVILLGTLLYLAILYFYFQDYIIEILPIAITQYAKQPFLDNITTVSLCFLMVGISLLSLVLMHDNKQEKDIALLFVMMSMLSVISLYMQNKGFSVHMIPTLSLFYVSACITTALYLKTQKLTEHKKRGAFVIFPVAFLYLYYANGLHISTANDYKKSSLAQTIEEMAGDSSYFFEAYSTNVFYSQSLYTQNRIASRFPSLWFLGGADEMTIEQREKHIQKFGNYMAQDFQIYKPKIIALLGKTQTNLMNSLFKDHAKMQEVWENYEFDRSYVLKRSELSDFILTKGQDEQEYSIYVRK